ncbi:D-alanyl-D-alanine carboxypeptidase [hydrothermal vent metagenome]|uniref:serine-type D-Ala-D-Ala carboxypeptidase n=1 Tax=hydrothermal vent metagenome TaxID=652676 RepID=A0A3B0UJQ3_9ZZZZ
MRFIKILLAVFGAWALLSVAAYAQLDFSTKARFAILMDYQSGTVLFQKNADKPMEPASMAKLMTLAVVFDQIALGRLTLDDEFFISETAWREGGASSGGSTMFAKLGSKISVENLIKSVIIQSGNDASIALAEGIAGTEGTFTLMMNDLAQQIGLTSSNFSNATGLPDPNLYTTARDLALLARYIIKTYPQYYPIFSEPSFTWNRIKQNNRNLLLNDRIGVDGMKTGHTVSAGYGIVISTTMGGRRLIAVLHGLETMRQRAEEARKLITWGTRAFERVEAFKDGAIVGYANVYGGEEPNVALVAEGDLNLYLPRGGRRCLSARIVYQSPIRPPVVRGDKIAQLRVYCDERLIQSAPLFAAQSVEEGSLVRKSIDALKQLALGWL